MTMHYVDTAQWQQATGVARQVCARVFRDGGAPADALEAFGLAHPDLEGDWHSAVDTIAHQLCTGKNEMTPKPVLRQAA